MASTRFSEDEARVRKQLEISTFACRYSLDVPGNGIDLPFIEEPQLRLQKWGANLHSGTTAIESDLFGLTRKYCRDHPEDNDYRAHAPRTHALRVATTQAPFVCESRAAQPAWNLRGIEIPRWETPFLNPQAAVDKAFHDNIQTRLLEKDHFRRG